MLFIWMSFLMVQFGFDQKASGRTLMSPDCSFVCVTANMNCVWWGLRCNVSDLQSMFLQALIVQFMYSLSRRCFLCVSCKRLLIKRSFKCRILCVLLSNCSPFTSTLKSGGLRNVWIGQFDTLSLPGAGVVPGCTTRWRCWTSAGTAAQTRVQPGVTLRPLIQPGVYLSVLMRTRLHVDWFDVASVQV